MLKDTSKVNKKDTPKKITRFLKFSKRQWGTERNMNPLSEVHEQPSNAKIATSRFFVVLTILFWIMYVVSVIIRQVIEGPNTYKFTLETVGYLVTVTFLNFSALIYLISRQGAFQRFSKHIRTSRTLLEKYFNSHTPSITVLVPSYDEEPQVIRKTLLSAALQEYPKIKVVLLLDDDYRKVKPNKLERFQTAQSLGKDIQQLLAEPYNKFNKALKQFEQNNKSDIITGGEILKISSQYTEASAWLNKMAEKETIEDHVDVFFADQVFRKLANELELVATALNTSHKENASITKTKAIHLYTRLTWIFGAELDVFERKRYASLSHELNKAMNINSYIGLMGGNYIKEETPEGIVLIPTTKPTSNTLNIPDSEFILTLDADSILLQEYCLRLVYLMQQPDNADVAVSQTPYSSFRGASTRIERLAGATTDVQHILHQGMTFYGATFWVGANAVIRKKALEDIVEKEWVGGYEIKRYVQDRTVIEDTESSIDLAVHGWRLLNYPERLSYSATPPDFGSLIVQRRRWANGGLLILPKLWAQNKNNKHKEKQPSKMEYLIRLNYMASIAWSNIGLVFLLAYPYDGRLLSPFVLLGAVPYFIAMASDLKYCRYSYSDILRIYGFNLILLPVNLAGVFKSIEQALTTKKIPFSRTPKVKDRTRVELPYVIAPLLIVGFSIHTLIDNIQEQNWGNAAFAGFNAITATWAIITYIGIWNLIVDIWLGLTDWLYVDVPVTKASKKDAEKPELNWKNIIYHGDSSTQIKYNTINNFSIEQ